MTILSDELLSFEKSFSHKVLAPQIDARIGLVQLATDYVLENDWHKVLGNRIELVSTRMPFNSIMDASTLSSMKERIAASAALLAPGLKLDVLVYGCTSASMLIGDQEVAKQLTLHRPNLPTTNPWRSVVEALKALNAQRIAVLTPYTSEVNLSLYQALNRERFNVAAFGAFQLRRDTDVPAIHPDSIELALSQLLEETSLERTPVDAIFLSCTNLRVMPVIDRIERRFGLPVVASNQAMLWHALRLIGNDTRFDGFGQLLTQR